MSHGDGAFLSCCDISQVEKRLSQSLNRGRHGMSCLPGAMAHPWWYWEAEAPLFNLPFTLVLGEHGQHLEFSAACSVLPREPQKAQEVFAARSKAPLLDSSLYHPR